MRMVIQRAKQARVVVDTATVGEIQHGWLVLLGVDKDDGAEDASYLAEKLAGLRAFADSEGKMNRSVSDIRGSVLVVSQFTLQGDCRKGKRPSFTRAAAPETAERLYQFFVKRLTELGLPVATGRFGASMQVELVNDGPVTFILDSKTSR